MEANTLNAKTAAVCSVAAIERDAGVAVKDCYQCGKCSAGCPVAPDADLTPREVIRKLQLGLVDDVLEAKMPWMCVGCGMCLARCPQCVDLPNLMSACRRAAKASGRIGVSEADRFSSIFMSNVELQGVSNEALLAMRFNFTTGHLFQDVLGAPKMAALGMLTGEEHKNDKQDVREVMQRARAVAAQEAQAREAAAREEFGFSEPALTPATSSEILGEDSAQPAAAPSSAVPTSSKARRGLGTKLGAWTTAALDSATTTAATVAGAAVNAASSALSAASASGKTDKTQEGNQQ